MNSSDSPESSGVKASHSGRGRGPMGRRTAGGIAVVALLAVYSFVQPKLNENLGWNLPGLRQDGRGQVVVDKSKKPKFDSQSKGSSNAQSSSNKGAAEIASGPLANRMNSDKGNQRTTSQRELSQSDNSDGDLLYGILREVSAKRYMSPAGLSYTPGSAEGHRLEHLKRHTVDMKSRPVHGVFDGDMEGALKTIDLAYQRAQKNQNTTKKVERGRTVYTVDMGKRIGFVGGQSGQRKNNPFSRRVRLVLEGNRVITAFPL